MTRIIKGRTGFCVETIELKLRVESDFLELGRRLVEIKVKNLWQGSWLDWGEFLDDLKISDATASRLMRIYSIFVGQCKIAPAQIARAGGWTVLSDILPTVEKHPEKARYWFDVASSMQNRTDLRRTLHEEKAGTDMLSCPHDDTYLLRVCRGCGLRVTDYETNIKLLPSKIKIHEKVH